MVSLTITRRRLLALARRILGADRDLGHFDRAAARIPWLAPLAARMRGVKPPRYPTLWEACVNAIVFQQVSLLAASAIMRRLIVALGLIGACGSPEVDYLYTLTAASSEPPAGGPISISPVPRGGSAEDSLFRIDIDVRHRQVVVGILNKTSETAYLIWDQAAYVGPTGSAIQLVSGEARNLNVGLSQPPSGAGRKRRQPRSHSNRECPRRSCGAVLLLIRRSEESARELYAAATAPAH